MHVTAGMTSFADYIHFWTPGLKRCNVSEDGSTVDDVATNGCGQENRACNRYGNFPQSVIMAKLSGVGAPDTAMAGLKV